MNLSMTNMKMTALSLCAALIIGVIFIINPIYLLLIVAAGWIFALAWLFPKQVSILLCLGFLLHPFLIVRVVPYLFDISGNALSLWKEGVLFALIIRSMTMRYKHQKNPHDWAMLLFIGIGTIYILVSPSFSIGLQGFRLYFESIAVYYITRRFHFESKDIQRFLKWFFGLTFAIGIWSLILTLFIGPKLLFWLGYQDEFGRLPSSFLIQGHDFLRAFGTTASPNNYGVITAITILLLLQYKDQFKSKPIYILFLLVQLSALVATFSRSTWLGLLLCAIVFFLNGSMLNKTKLVFGAGASLLLLIVVTLVFPNNYIAKFMEKTVTLQDSSAVGHASSYSSAIQYISLHPFGTGLGTAGPQSLLITGKLVNVESSFFLVAYEMGIAGLVILFILTSSLIISFLKRTDKLSQGIAYSWIVCFVSFLLLPTIQSMEVMYVLFFLMGMSVSHSNLFMKK